MIAESNSAEDDVSYLASFENFCRTEVRLCVEYLPSTHKVRVQAPVPSRKKENILAFPSHCSLHFSCMSLSGLKIMPQ
jgi:hypothetical protein